MVGPDVYFPIEITAREYAGHLLLATELAARGRIGIVGHKKPVARAMRAAAEAGRRGLLFYKLDERPKWAAPGHELVGMHPEAGITFRDLATFQRTTGFVSRREPNHAQFCYGPADFLWMVTNFPDLSHRFRLTGSPRVELWGLSGQHFYASESAQIVDRYGEFVLFTSSGDFAHEKVLGWHGKDPEATWKEDDGAHHFFATAREVANHGLSVVVRPHPADSWTAWQHLVSEVPGMQIDSTYDLAAWTRAAYAVVHSGTSTAAFEAISAGTPAVSTQSHWWTNAATDVSHLASDTQHLLELLEDARCGSLAVHADLQSKALFENKLLHPIEGAAARIADELDATIPFVNAVPTPYLQRAVARRNPMSLLRRKSSLRTLGDQRPRPFKRDPLVIDIVERDVSSCLQILGRKDSVRVQRLDDNCFALFV